MNLRTVRAERVWYDFPDRVGPKSASRMAWLAPSVSPGEYLVAVYVNGLHALEVYDDVGDPLEYKVVYEFPIAVTSPLWVASDRVVLVLGWDN